MSDVKKDERPVVRMLWCANATKTQATKIAKERGWKTFCLVPGKESKGYWVAWNVSEMPESYKKVAIWPEDFEKYVEVSFGWGTQVRKYRIPRAVAICFPGDEGRAQKAHVSA
jgi:hypothetical protein